MVDAVLVEFAFIANAKIEVAPATVIEKPLVAVVLAQYILPAVCVNVPATVILPEPVEFAPKNVPADCEYAPLSVSTPVAAPLDTATAPPERVNNPPTTAVQVPEVPPATTNVPTVCVNVPVIVIVKLEVPAPT